MPSGETKTTGKPKDARKQKLASALRNNLQRRKAAQKPKSTKTEPSKSG